MAQTSVFDASLIKSRYQKCTRLQLVPSLEHSNQTNETFLVDILMQAVVGFTFIGRMVVRACCP